MPSSILSEALLMSRNTTKDSKKTTAIAYFSKNHSTVLLTMKVEAMGLAMLGLYVSARGKNKIEK